MGERLLCKQEVIGSIPFASTKLSARLWPSVDGHGESGGWDAQRQDKVTKEFDSYPDSENRNKRFRRATGGVLFDIVNR